MDVSLQWSLLLLLAGLQMSRPWPAQRQQGVTAWPSPQQGGVVANVQVRHLGHSGHRSLQQQQQQPDLTPAAQTYSHFEQPVSVYQEFRLQQHHPPSAQYAASTEAVATTYAPQYYTESATVRSPPTSSPPPLPHPGNSHYSQAAAPPSPAAETTTTATHLHAKSLLKGPEDDIHHELQMQLSQQIQVQLEQLQKLHDLQNKMLRAPTTKAPPLALAVASQAVQQGSEVHVNRQLPPPNHAPHYAPPPPPFPQHGAVGGGATTVSPIVYATSPPSVTPTPPPLVEPRYPEESQSLTAFVGEQQTLPPVGSALVNGFQPILPPHHRDAAAAADSFHPFTEDATDPALPYYLLPPAEESDSQYNRLPVAAPAEPVGEVGDLEAPSGPSASASSSASASAEHDVVTEHPFRHSVRGKHRLRPPRGKGPGAMTTTMSQTLRKLCRSGTTFGAATAAACRQAAATRPRLATTRRPPPPSDVGAAAAGSALRLRIASPMLRFRDPVDPRVPLTLMAWHPGMQGRPPVTVMHAVQNIRVIKKA